MSEISSVASDLLVGIILKRYGGRAQHMSSTSTEWNLYPFRVHQSVTVTTGKSSMSSFPPAQYLASRAQCHGRTLPPPPSPAAVVRIQVLVLILPQ